MWHLKLCVAMLAVVAYSQFTWASENDLPREDVPSLRAEIRKLRSENLALKRKIDTLSEHLRGQEALNSTLNATVAELARTNARLQAELKGLSTEKGDIAREGSEGRLPYVGNEVTLPEIKANVRHYHGKEFILVGKLELEDDQKHIYEKKRYKEHYPSKDFIPFIFTNLSSARQAIGAETLNVQKGIGKTLMAVIAKATSDDKKRIVRLRCFWPKVAGEDAGEVSSWKIAPQIIGWQFLANDGHAWTEWKPCGISGSTMPFPGPPRR